MHKFIKKKTPYYSMKYSVIIEQDEDGMYIGKVSELRGCVTQGESIDELMSNMKEAISLYLQTHSIDEKTTFIGVQNIEVN